MFHAGSISILFTLICYIEFFKSLFEEVSSIILYIAILK